MNIKFKALAATLAAVTALSCASVTAYADKLKTVDGVTYRYSDSGQQVGKYTGWAKTSKGRYYYKDGVKVRNTWIKNKKGEYRYLGSDGRMVTGWYDVKQGKEGRFSWFNESGVWDGQTYYSRYDEYEGFGNTVTIKVARNEIISESMSRYLDNGLGSEKKARSYVLDNNEYELEIPLAVADQLTVGDKLIVSPNVKRGEKVDGEYQYKLCIQTLYSPNKGDEMYRYNKDSGTILEKVTEARMELFNKLLVLKSGKLKLDMMFGAYGLDWDYLESEDFYKEPYVYTHIRRDSDGNRYDEYTYGLFGGSNEFNEKTGKYAFRNNTSEKTLKKLMKNKIAEHKADLEKSKNDDVDWYEWVGNMQSCWLDVIVTEIPVLPAAAAPTAGMYEEYQTDVLVADDEEETWSSADSVKTIPELYNDYIVLLGGVYYVNIENEPSWKGRKFTKTELSPGDIRNKTEERDISKILPNSANVLPVGTKLWWSKEYPNTVLLAEYNGLLIPYYEIVEG